MALYNKGGMHPKRIFKKPEELEQAFEDYKEDLVNKGKEWLKVSYVGKDGDRVAEPQKLPMTFVGFEVYCYNKYGCIGQYFDNKDECYTDFVVICSHIKKEIAENQITGGMLGFYNPSITQRLNNLTERNDITTQGEKLSQPVFNLNYAAPTEEE